MKYSFLLIGIVMLVIGLFFMNTYTLQNNTTSKGLFFAIVGIFLISKELRNIKELPSKKFKEDLKKKEGK